ncbi:HEPN domain-containing protein [Paraburkholderia gardini]|uniref:HEPN domain-containing protein n=1 Tax=Paraburkholderia gardini TaxID=2823469 RepID=UPI001D220965|nr:HEPN domain-containing protein [Paraburkholderia gardini]CAG4893745.1 hypothetical protein R69919_01714 [Paraburkholderia gardini]
MSNRTEHVAILRCQTWNVWPDMTSIKGPQFSIQHDEESLPARLAILSYPNRKPVEAYQDEDTKLGPLVWTGTVPGLYVVRDAILKDPADVIQLTVPFRHGHRGEIDLCLNFLSRDEHFPAIVDVVRSTLSAVAALINLRLHDYLTPMAPLQIRKVAAEGGQIGTELQVSVLERRTLSTADIEACFSGIGNALYGQATSAKLTVALELYAAHFVERQVRVRFLLLVMAMESLAKETSKHDVAIALLKEWEQQLKSEMEKHEKESEAYLSLDALSREMQFRATDSIRSQVRKLFRELPDISEDESRDYQKRALRVYDKRSILVHDGFLPAAELVFCENESRALVERLLLALISPPESTE